MVFGLGMLLASAVQAQKVTTDYTKSVDFNQYKTFMWIKEPKASNPLVQQRIVGRRQFRVDEQGSEARDRRRGPGPCGPRCDPPGANARYRPISMRPRYRSTPLS
jgi:hypothetical protein